MGKLWLYRREPFITVTCSPVKTTLWGWTWSGWFCRFAFDQLVLFSFLRLVTVWLTEQWKWWPPLGKKWLVLLPFSTFKMSPFFHHHTQTRSVPRFRALQELLYGDATLSRGPLQLNVSSAYHDSTLGLKNGYQPVVHSGKVTVSDQVWFLLCHRDKQNKTKCSQSDRERNQEGRETDTERQW